MMTIDRFIGEYSFLSNSYESPIEVDGIIYPTVEHALQASKTKNILLKQKIASCPSAGSAYILGKTITPHSEWESYKTEIIRDLLTKKFSDPELMRKLKDTGNAYLINTNYHGEDYFGVSNGYGFNICGIILMQLRDSEIK